MARTASIQRQHTPQYPFPHDPTEKRAPQTAQSGNLLGYPYAGHTVLDPVDRHSNAIFSNPELTVHHYEDGIRQHLDRRVQLFFQWAILCYNTPFYYEVSGALDQIGRGSTVRVENAEPYRSEAAHSATLPCLIAIPKGSDGSPIREQAFVFLRGSHTYNLHNSTMVLPAAVNRADELIDNGALRVDAIDLINRVALGILEPKEATRLFIGCLQNRIQELPLKTKNDQAIDAVAAILSKRVQELIRGLTDSQFFDQIMSLQIGQSERADILREVVYLPRYRLIQSAEAAHSIVARILLDLQSKIFSKKDPHIKTDLRFCLLANARGEELDLLQRFFCCSIEQLLAGKPARAREKIERKFQVLYDKNQKRFQRVFQKLQRLQCSLKDNELDYRSAVFKGMRTRYLGYTQEILSRVFREQNPGVPMSRSMVSRFEQRSRSDTKTHYLTPLNQRRKDISVDYALRISSTHGVDAGIFVSALV